jgi:anaerobic selenocysteine-containing dehydrogenase
MTNRREFLKSAGLITAAAAILNPFEVFAQTSKLQKGASSKKMQLTFRAFDAQMRHVFTIANSSRTTTPS